MSKQSKSIKKPIKENVWVGESSRKKADRAEIFAPSAAPGIGGTKYKLTAKGGRPGSTSSVGKVSPAPKPVPPASASKPAPAKKPVPTKKKVITKKPATAKVATTPASQSKAMAEAVTSSFLDRLTDEAKRKGGTLTVEDLEGMNQEFAEKAEALQVVFEKSFEEYVRVRERSSWEQSRKYPFDRIIVKSFSHLFADDKGLLEADDTISRRILPGFFMALAMMLGADLIKTYQEQCRKIVAKIKKDSKEAFDWDKVYSDKQARKIVLDAQVTIAIHFKDMKKRGEWFIDLINSHLPPLGSDRNPDEKAWTFTDKALQRFIGSLMSDLKKTLSDEGGRMYISKRHGVETCVELADIIKQFESSR